MKAGQILAESIETLENRGEFYSNGEERNFVHIATAFNAATGHKLSAAEVCYLLVCVKLVRAGRGKFKPDNNVDGAGYFALAAEEEGREERDVREVSVGAVGCADGCLNNARYATPAEFEEWVVKHPESARVSTKLVVCALHGKPFYIFPRRATDDGEAR